MASLLMRRCAGPRPQSRAAERASGCMPGPPGAALACMLWSLPDLSIWRGRPHRAVPVLGPQRDSFPQPRTPGQDGPSRIPSTSLCLCVLASEEMLSRAKRGVASVLNWPTVSLTCQSQDREPPGAGPWEQWAPVSEIDRAPSSAQPLPSTSTVESMTGPTALGLGWSPP